jgi:hypothetical protein
MSCRFAVWVAVILALQAWESVGEVPRAAYPWSYALKSVACAALFLGLRPWRVYPALAAAPCAVGSGCGLAVALRWILPRRLGGPRRARFQLFYHRG